MGILVASLAAGAQQTGNTWRVGIWETTSSVVAAPLLDALREGLRERGYIEGRNIVRSLSILSRRLRYTSDVLRPTGKDGIDQKRSRKIVLGIGAISIISCMYLFRRPGVEVCVYGSGLFAGCTGDCGYASVPNSGDLMIGGEYRISGTLIHSETSRPIQAMPVVLIMPTRTRYVTRSDVKGRFTLLVKPDSRVERREIFRVNLEFARMETVPDAKQIVLCGDLTKAFRETHPELTYVDVKVSEFRGKTVRVNSVKPRR